MACMLAKISTDPTKKLNQYANKLAGEIKPT